MDPVYASPQSISKKGMVVTCSPLAAEVGVKILRKGGNAADAFVATTLAEYVTAHGYTSLSGPLSLLYYEAKDGKAKFLNAGLNTVSDPMGQRSDTARVPGTSYVIGGAGRGIESLYQRFGSPRFTWKELVKPAVQLAKEGFKISPRFARAIRRRLPALNQSKDWLRLYTKNAGPLSEGDILLQPELAKTLTQVGELGADYLFKGKFSENLVRTIQAQGGKVTREDLASYQVNWSEPQDMSYRGFRIQTSSYRSYGGVQLLLAMKALENDRDISSRPHFSLKKKDFETLLRTYLFSLKELFPLILGHSSIFDSNVAMGNFLKGPQPKQIWSRATNNSIPAPFTQVDGTHSCNTVVIDRNGNIATGTHTINSIAWGEFGLFTDGVILNSACPVTLQAPPGTRAIDGLTPLLAFENDEPIVAAGFFSSGLQAAAFQVLVNLLDYGMSPQKALEAPRFGAITQYSPANIFLDSRYPKSWVSEFAKKGITFLQEGPFIDTGMGMVIRIDPSTGVRLGMASELLDEAVSVSEVPEFVFRHRIIDVE
jgi:gamma-glutamyltranspeptidase/glutathione hydrolase